MANNCGRLDATNAANRSAISSDIANFIYFCGEAPSNGSGFLSMSPEAFSYQGETKRGSLAIDWKLAGVEIQSLTSYTSVNNYGQNDLDRTQAGDCRLRLHFARGVCGGRFTPLYLLGLRACGPLLASRGRRDGWSLQSNPFRELQHLLWCVRAGLRLLVH